MKYLCGRCKRKHRISVWGSGKDRHFICGQSGRELKENEVIKEQEEPKT